MDVQKYEEEQYLAHEKANSCSRVSLIVFFSVLFSFVNPSTFRGVSVRRSVDGFRHRIVQLYDCARGDAFKEEETKEKERRQNGLVVVLRIRVVAVFDVAFDEDFSFTF